MPSCLIIALCSPFCSAPESQRDPTLIQRSMVTGAWGNALENQREDRGEGEDELLSPNGFKNK